MKEFTRLTAVLCVISLVAGLLLAFVNRLTAEPIAQARRAAKLEAIAAVLPSYDNRPDETVCTVSESGQPWAFYIATQEGRYVGCAVESVSSKGYGGNIGVMVGVRADNTLGSIRILEHKETPGLGSNISQPSFLSHFKGRDLAETVWRVTKDKGDIDAVTAATISSRAVLEAVQQAVDVYLAHESDIRGTVAGGSNP